MIDALMFYVSNPNDEITLFAKGTISNHQAEIGIYC